jgi:hypothetical protein
VRQAADAEEATPVRAVEDARGLGPHMVAYEWTSPSVPARLHPEGNQANPGTALQLLAAIAAELEARGLMVRELHGRAPVAEIVASSPVHPERGSPRIGCDGFLIWERRVPAADSDRTAIVRLIAWVLMGDELPAAGSPR